MSSNSHPELTSGIYINNEKYNDWRIGQIHYSIKDNIIMTLYYHKQSTVIPDYWIHEKKNEWILFPWETVDSTK